jgi:hypothetical protein
MPDRVERPDASSIYKVLEADRTQDEEGSGNKQEAEENEKDRFNPSSNKTSKNIATASGSQKSFDKKAGR